MISVDAAQMRAVSRLVREAGDKELKKALTRGTGAAVEPAKDAVRSSARAELPHRGGLAVRVAGAKFRVQRLTGAAPGIVLSMSVAKESGGGKMDLKRMNAGSLRHPVFDQRHVRHRTWVLQRIPDGWFTRPLEALKPQIAREVAAVVQGVADALAAMSRDAR